MKFKELKKNHIYESVEGWFRFTGFRNSNIANFEEVSFTDSGHVIVLDDCIYKTESDCKMLYEV